MPVAGSCVCGHRSYMWLDSLLQVEIKHVNVGSVISEKKKKQWSQNAATPIID